VRPSEEEYLHVAVKVPMECPTPEAADAIAGLAQWAGRVRADNARHVVCRQHFQTRS
jgi:hypothetical protein